MLDVDLILELSPKSSEFFESINTFIGLYFFGKSRLMPSVSLEVFTTHALLILANSWYQRQLHLFLQIR